jgi:histidine ammonia-lyase
LLTALQAIDYLNVQDRLSVTTKSVYEKLRAIVPRFEKDSIKYPDTRNITNYILQNDPMADL